MDLHADRGPTANEALYQPAEVSDDASPTLVVRLAELRGEALRRLFPMRFAARAGWPRNTVALRIHAHLAEAATSDDLERRIVRLRNYPAEWIDDVRLRDGRSVLVRPVLPFDGAMHRAFVRSMSPTTRIQRFHGGVVDLPEPMLRYLTEVDHVDHFALVGEVSGGAGPRQVAEARWVRRDGDSSAADFAIAIADDYQRSGLGDRFLTTLQEAAAARGIERLHGVVLRSNLRMTGWLQARGWRIADDRDDLGVVWAELALNTTALRRWREAA